MPKTTPTNDRVATVGRRKRAVARVRLSSGTGKLVVNDRAVTNPHPSILQPLELVGLTSAVDITVKVVGGGTTGQAEAVRHGIARALIVYKPESKTTLKKAGFLTRDPREKERKKPGLKRARRAPQWAKR
ncbi:30S ribosomal protein S9 [Candidatus Berkelbacteria bacterium]|nr:30S ribosomal protein S9 [Candidatus Berkelbacteria bacterium]